jgi:AcrR family transcriptional regulator
MSSVASQLTRERIVETAIELADAEGFEAVTLRRIAGELGVHVTSLYNHVATREAVTDAIVDRLIAEANLPQAPENWEDWVRGFFEEVTALAARHPGAFAAFQLRPVQRAESLVSFESALDAFMRAGLDVAGAYSAVKTATLTALSVGLEQAIAARGGSASTDVDALPVESFPHLHALDSGDTLDETAWAFSLETLVAGLRAQVKRPAGSRGRPGA